MSVNQKNPLTGGEYSKSYYELLEKRKKLPVYAYKEKFMKSLDSHQCVCVVGEAGAGKTTQLPQWALEYARRKSETAGAARASRRAGKVVVTHPQALVAKAAAARVAQELDVRLGEQVGYSVVLEEKVMKNTMLKYATDEALVRETFTSPMLSGYRVIIVDDAHERTAATDLLLGLLKVIVDEYCSDIKVVVICATLDAGKFNTFFGRTALLRMPIVRKSVQVFYKPGVVDVAYLEATIQCVISLHSSVGQGDFLVFLPTEADVDEACRRLREWSAKKASAYGVLRCFPLHALLTLEQLQRIYLPTRTAASIDKPGRKCIIATDIAASSFTVGGVAFVVDSGFERIRVYGSEESSIVDTHIIVPTSQWRAEQRAARAAPAVNGKCTRLYCENAFKRMRANTAPEVLRLNVSRVELLLRRAQEADEDAYAVWMDEPPSASMQKTLRELKLLGAVEGDFDDDLSSVGSEMAEFAVETRYAKYLLSAERAGCALEMSIIVAMLSVPEVFVTPWDAKAKAEKARRKFAHIDGDHLTLLNVYQAFKRSNESEEWCTANFLHYNALKHADRIRSHIDTVMKRNYIDVVSKHANTKRYYTSIKEAFACSSVKHIAYRSSESGEYKDVESSQTVTLHPSTVLKRLPKVVLYDECVYMNGQGDCAIRTLTDIKNEWVSFLEENGLMNEEPCVVCDQEQLLDKCGAHR